MILYDNLFKPRKLPGWWLRFTEANPIVPNLIAVTGLVWICFSIALLISASEKHGHGQIIETLGLVSKSEPFIEKAISLRAAYHQLIPDDVRNLVASLYGNVALYLVVPFLLLLEFLFPSNPSQPLIGKGFLQDAIWYAIYTPVGLLIISPVLVLLSGLFEHHLGFLALSNSSRWPVFIQIMAALLLAEFFAWINHFARHKIRTLWLFHAIHHSQKEINVFTDDRVHVVDLLIGSLLAFIPFFIFHVPAIYAVTVIGVYKPIHNRFIHSNTKMNLGWLGWIFTSPQFHRVHHSVDPAHMNNNYGVYFSIFDHLFGTACPSRNIYPETGIPDARFPTEDKVRIYVLPVNLLMQIVYPFVQLFEILLASTRRLVSYLSGFRPRITKNITEPDNIGQENEVRKPRRVKPLM